MCFKHLFVLCLLVSQAKLDQYHRQMEQDVSVMVNSVRREGVDRIIKLRKKYGCTKDSDELTLTQLKVQKRETVQKSGLQKKTGIRVWLQDKK